MAIVCNCPGKCQIHPVYEAKEEKQAASPNISVEDKLTLKTLEAQSLKAQLEARDADEQFRNFAQAVCAKSGLNPSEWMFDVKELKFVQRK